MHYIEEIIRATPAGGHALTLIFADGFTATLDLAPALNGEFLAPMRESVEVFQLVALEDGVPVWPNGADMDPATLRIWAEAGKVLSDEDTNRKSAEYSRSNQSMAGAA